MSNHNDIRNYDDYLKQLGAEIDRLAASGEPVNVDPDVADYMGAIEDDALDLQDALESMELEKEAHHD